MDNDRRKQRLTWEALGDMDPTVPGCEKALVRAVVIVALISFIVVFSGTYPGI